ncbi:MAG: protoporphyrinogen/coproporphyrinogen oxidase [Planctomycetota bacterium]
MKVAILGAGVTGLTLARLLDSDGHRLKVFERSRTPGGLCKSSLIEGFTVDHAGGHILYSKDVPTLDWMLDRVGRGNFTKTERQTRILWHDRYVPYPFENGIGELPPEARFDCLKGYLEARNRRDQGEPCPGDFHGWIQWRMGQGFADHFMNPYNEKLWECDLSTMSSEWVQGRVPEAPVDDIIKAAVGIRTEGYTHQSVFYYPNEGGFQALTDGTARGIERLVSLDTGVDSVRQAGEAWRVNGEDFDLVVNTIPLPELAKVFEDLPAGLAGEIGKLEPISLVNVLFGVESDEPLPPLSWIYLPFASQGPANRVTFFSNYGPNNAPPGHVSYMAEVTYRRELDVSSDWLDDLGRSLEELGLLKRSDVKVRSFFRSRYAYIDQNLEFPARIRRVREWFDRSGMLTIGRFGRYEYHNSDQCIMRAGQAHAQIRRMAESGLVEPFVIG